MSKNSATLDKSRDHGVVCGDASYRYEQDGKMFDATGKEVTPAAASAPESDAPAPAPVPASYDEMNLKQLQAAKKAHPGGEGTGFKFGTKRVDMIAALKALDAA